jgi:hypothetical protein
MIKQNYQSFRFLLAGNSKYMPTSVKKSFMKILGNIIPEGTDAEQEYTRLENSRQIVFETWN